MDSSNIDGLLRGAVENGAVPGVVAVAGDRDGTLYEGAFGHLGVADDRPARPDTVFLIASMMVRPRFSELAFGDYWSGPGGTSGRKSPVFLRDRIATIVRSIFGSAGLESFVHIHIVGIERDLCGCQPLAMCHLLQG